MTQHQYMLPAEMGIIDLVGELIQQSKSNQIPVEFDLSGHLQS